MAIEIKELHIKVTVSETTETNAPSTQKLNPLQVSEMKSDIVRECTQRVLEKIKEKQER
jgi:Family of unknown function (DUF5908)